MWQVSPILMGSTKLHSQPSDMPGWKQTLSDSGVAIEGRTEWPKGGSSIYFRDPDHNLIELLTPGCWPIY